VLHDDNDALIDEEFITPHCAKDLSMHHLTERIRREISCLFEGKFVIRARRLRKE
jgi:hypothetical protein